jgi:hypothetical protein
VAARAHGRLLNTLVLVPHVGISKNGARRWLPMGFTQLQPSELAKWAVVLFLAWWMTRRNVDTRKFLRGFVPTLVPVGHDLSADRDPGFRHGRADRDLRADDAARRRINGGTSPS